MLKIRILLWIVPFKYIKGRMKLVNNSSKMENREIYRVKWAVMVARNYLPKATCLTNALTAQQLFSEMNYPSTVKIGVGKDSEGGFEAHAWLESDGQVIIGESEKNYVYLLDLNKRG